MYIQYISNNHMTVLILFYVIDTICIFNSKPRRSWNVSNWETMALDESTDF